MQTAVEAQGIISAIKANIQGISASPDHTNIINSMGNLNNIFSNAIEIVLEKLDKQVLEINEKYTDIQTVANSLIYLKELTTV